MGDAALALAGEQVRLLPERALWWEAAGTLVAADLHWGKAATFRAAGVPLPSGTTADDLARLARVLARTGARRLVLLGDLFHARPGRRSGPTLDAIARWRDAHAGLDVLLVRGNHDRHAGDPPAELGFAVVDGPHALPPFVLRHEPARGAADAGYALAGHVHPGVVLTGPGRARERLPCYVIGASDAVLPAFGGFTGTATLPRRAGDRLFAVADDEVIALP